MGEITVDTLYRNFLCTEILMGEDNCRKLVERILKLIGYEKRLPSETKVIYYLLPNKNNVTLYEILNAIDEGHGLDQMGIECFGRWVSLLGVIAILYPIDSLFIDYLKDNDGGVRGNYPLIASMNPNATEDIRLWAKLQ